MIWIAATTLLLGAADEAALRERFESAFRAGPEADRVKALESLKGAKEPATLGLAAAALKDPAKDVRAAAAAALESMEDRTGAALEALGVRLNDKQEDPGVRLACARALAKSPYKAAPFRFLLDCISGVTREDKHLYRFGADVTGIIDGFIGKSYGADKVTAELWENWWADNQARLKAADAATRKRLTGE
jgi:hypothetical protein